MEFTLLENGTDSLKKAKKSIEDFEGTAREFSYHLLKDSIIFLNHGIEILLKYILSQQNESLIFTDLKPYIAAKKYLKKMPLKNGGFGIHIDRNKPTIFDVPSSEIKKQKLNTITLTEALDRVEYLCDIDMKEDFKNGTYVINDYRNQITHHSINLDSSGEEYLINTLKLLYDNALDFFEVHIPGIMKEIDNERFVITKAEWEEIQQDMQTYYHEKAMSDLSEDDLR